MATGAPGIITTVGPIVGGGVQRGDYRRSRDGRRAIACCGAITVTNHSMLTAALPLLDVDALPKLHPAPPGRGYSRLVGAGIPVVDLGGRAIFRLRIHLLDGSLAAFQRIRLPIFASPMSDVLCCFRAWLEPCGIACVNFEEKHGDDISLSATIH